MPSKAQSLVVGISGGIDSSVSSTIKCYDWLKDYCFIYAY